VPVPAVSMTLSAVRKEQLEQRASVALMERNLIPQPVPAWRWAVVRQAVPVAQDMKPVALADLLAPVSASLLSMEEALAVLMISAAIFRPVQPIAIAPMAPSARRILVAERLYAWHIATARMDLAEERKSVLRHQRVVDRELAARP
jgi:hypothetical protein